MGDEVIRGKTLFTDCSRFTIVKEVIYNLAADNGNAAMERSRQHRLARTVGANHGPVLVVTDGPVDMLQYAAVPKLKSHITKCDKLCALCLISFHRLS
ncbi:MAG: hypothetical protein Kow0099_18250 [Candidatus Abyssubacteria bacterium]